MGLLVLIVAFVVVPIVELWVILTVGAHIGILPTLMILLAVSVLGGWTVKRIGLGVWRRARATSEAGRIPGDELLDGSVVLGAGALLLVPGFVTDLCGLLLLVPVVRRSVASLVKARVAHRLGVSNVQVRTVRVESSWSSRPKQDVVDGRVAGETRELEA